MSQVTGKEVLVKSFRARGPEGLEVKGAIWRDTEVGTGASSFKLTICLKIGGGEEICTTKPISSFSEASALYENNAQLWRILGWQVTDII